MLSLLGQGGLTYSNGIPATGLDLKMLLLSAAGIYLLLTLCMRCLGRYSRLRREVVPVTLLDVYKRQPDASSAPIHPGRGGKRTVLPKTERRKKTGKADGKTPPKRESRPKRDGKDNKEAGTRWFQPLKNI